MSTMTAAHEKQWFGHPRGLATLFFTEMWERFSYYGMRALLILYMVGSTQKPGLGFSTVKSAQIYGLYTMLVYLMGVPGGWIADRFLGHYRAVLVGGIIIACGHFSMAFPSLATFYLGLGLIIIGTGLLKPNVSTIVGTLYTRDDPRRDAGFSLFYMGINTGAFFAPITIVHPAMGAEIITVAFVVVVIGGLGSFWGVVIAALLVGVIRGITIHFAPAAGEASIYVLMFLVLLVRPRGLLGERIEKFE